MKRASGREHYKRKGPEVGVSQAVYGPKGVAGCSEEGGGWQGSQLGSDHSLV